MNVDELHKLYAAGERDFREVNLIGANLERAYLVGVNFSGAYLAAATLSRAILTGANRC